MRTKLPLLLLVIVTHVYTLAQDDDCVALSKGDTSVSRKLLQEQQATRRSGCLSAAIAKLGEARDESAVQLLARYLDYLDPASTPQVGGGADVRPHYPAITALFLIGKSAAPELLSLIQTGRSAKIRENAATTYLFVYRDDLASGIQLLKKTEETSDNGEKRRALNKTIRMLEQACTARGAKQAEQCKNIAKK